MKRRFTILSAAMVLLAFLAFPLGMRGQSDYSTDYTGNITLSTAGGTSASSCNVQIDEVNYPGIKAGTGSVAGAMKITVPADTKYLHLHVAAWNNDNVTLTVTPEGYSDDIDLTANSGISGNSPYIFSGDPSTEDFYKVITFTTALAEETELTFTATSGKRFVVWGVTSEEGGTDPYISISGDGIAGNAVTLDYNDENVYTATVTYSNMEEPEASDVVVGLYADAACETGFDDTWFVAGFVTGSVTSIEYMAEANTSMDPRTVYMRVDNLFEEEWAPCNVIAITQLGVPTYTVTYMANGGTGFMDDEDSPYFENDVVILLANEFTAPEGMMWDSWEVKGEDGEDIEVIDGMFEMPAKNVIVTAQWVEDPDAPQYEWVLTDIADLTTDDIFVIVGTRGGTYAGSYAMSNDNGFDAAPSAVAVTIANDKLTEIPAENLRWNITGDNTYGYTFYKNGSIIEWLYCTDANNGLRVGGGEDDDPESYFTISEEGYLFSMEHERYVGIYTNQDWRSYTTINNNISGQTFGFYKRQEQSTDPSITITPSTVNAEATLTIITDITLTVSNFEVASASDFGVQFYNALGEEQEMPEWCLVSGVGGNSTIGGYIVPCVINSNPGAERTAYFKVYANDADSNRVYSNLVTVNQASDPTYAVLPFEYDGDASAIETTDGLYYMGLNSLDESPKLDFFRTGSWLLLQFEEAPGTLSFDVKGIGFSDGTFKVMTSEDGETYSDLETYNELGDTQSESFDLDENVRFIKWVYTEQVEGDVALGNIVLTKAPEVDYARLPFEYTDDDVLNGLDNMPSGLTQQGLGIYTSSTPRLKFSATNNELVLNSNVAPAAINFDIKGNGFSGGTFTVQVSEDGETYTNIAEYTELSGLTKRYTLLNTNQDVRYVKWVYTNKSNGNVALGNLHVTADLTDIEGDLCVFTNLTLATLTIPEGQTCTIYNGGILNVTGSLVNEGTAENLIIADGAQLKTPNAVHGTIQKHIVGYGLENEEEGNGYYLLKSPVPSTMNLEKALNAGMVNGTLEAPEYEGIDLYYFDQREEEEEWQNVRIDEFFATFGIPANVGYLYANVNDVTLSFATYNDGEESCLFAPTTIDTSILAGRYPSTSDFIGWELIGNPFTCDAYLASGRDFYRMNANGDAFMLATVDKVIKPCEGIFVVIEEEDPEIYLSVDGITYAQVSFTTIDPQRTNALMDVTVSRNGEMLDAARVRFNNGSMLNKMVLDGNATRLSIAQGNKDYSVVRSEAQGEMPVNFKAAENGTYTLSFTNEDVTFDYLHLIDNMTGADVDLLATPSYTFNASTSDYASRFRVVFSANSVFEGQDNVNFAYFNGSEWVVNGEGTMQVIDMMGRVISSETINGSANLNVNATSGVYMIRIVNGDNVKVQKIVVR